MLKLKLKKLCIKILSEDLQPQMFDDFSEDELKELFVFLKTNNLHISVYTYLRKNSIEIPGDTSTEIKEMYYAACSVDFRRKQQLKEIIKLFNDNFIDHILLKGAALAYVVYNESFTRLMCDVDILVKKKDGGKAFKLLQKNGYNSFIETVNECEKIKHQFNQHYPSLAKEGCLPVELHTYLSKEYHANIDEIWNRAVNINIDNLQSKIMSYEDLIHHIAMHKLVHDASLNGLLGLYDINIIMGKVNLDFRKLIKLTEDTEYNNKKCLCAVFHLIHKLFNKDYVSNISDLINVDLYSSVVEDKFVNIIFNDYSTFDKDSFLLGLNMKDAGQSFSTVMSRIFMSPYKMRLYGENKYGKRNLTFINLGWLYIKRILNMSYRYSLSVFKYLFVKSKISNSIKLGKTCAELKYWLKN